MNLGILPAARNFYRMLLNSQNRLTTPGFKQVNNSILVVWLHPPLRASRELAEAIIDRPTWEKMQNLKKGKHRKRPTVTRKHSAFSGVLKCPECRENLNFCFNQGNHDIKFFSCRNQNSALRKCSKSHYMRVEFLEWGLHPAN